MEVSGNVNNGQRKRSLTFGDVLDFGGTFDLLKKISPGALIL